VTLASIDIDADILRALLRMADSHQLPIATLASRLLREGLAVSQRRQRSETAPLDRQLGLPLVSLVAASPEASVPSSATAPRRASESPAPRPES
jgi:hypothetical protein